MCLAADGFADDLAQLEPGNILQCLAQLVPGALPPMITVICLFIMGYDLHMGWRRPQPSTAHVIFPGGQISNIRTQIDVTASIVNMNVMII